jgi:hypothetical protein
VELQGMGGKPVERLAARHVASGGGSSNLCR